MPDNNTVNNTNTNSTENDDNPQNVQVIEPTPDFLLPIEPTASFAVDIIANFTLNINKKIDPPLYSKCIVHFRPRGNQWRGQNFGLDWVRIGDSGMWSDNKEQNISQDSNVKCEDHYLQLMGKYFQNGSNTPADNPNEWRYMNDGITSCSFRLDLNQYKDLIRNSFPIAFSVPWKTIVKEKHIKFHSSIADSVKPEITRCNYTYYCPILFVRQGETANLRLRIEQFGEGTNPIRLEFEEFVAEGETASATPNFSFSSASIAPFPADKADISITCNRVIDDFKYIDAFAVFNNADTLPNQPPEIRKLCGRLRVHPNNVIRQLKVLLIPVAISHTGFPNESYVGSLPAAVTNETNRIFNHQCLVDLDIANYPDLTLGDNVPSLDTPPVQLRIADYFDASGDKITRISDIAWAAYNNDLNTAATTAQAQIATAQQAHNASATTDTQTALTDAQANPQLDTHRFDQHVKLFVVNANTSEAHTTNVARSYIILFNNAGAETLSHELMHTLGLLHPFSSNEEFRFKAQQTENLMDYCHINSTGTALSPGTPRLSVWYWQLKKIWRQIDTVNFRRERREGLNPVAPAMPPAEASNEVTIGTDRKLAVFESVAKI